MGLFDFFKDGDDYEGAHNSRRSSGKKATFSVSKFKNNKELVDWLEDNKVILLSEDEGLVVYTNDDEENFLQLYTSTSEAKNEDLSEYVEVTAEDLRDLLHEMPDISYFVLNPSSHNILIRREEVLRENLEAEAEEAVELNEEVAPTESEVVTVPLDFEVTSEAHFSEPVSDELDEETEFENLIESEVLVEEELELPEEVEVDTTEIPNNQEKEVKTEMNYEVATSVPQSIISAVLTFTKKGVKKFYLAQEKQYDFNSLHFMIGTDQDIWLDEELIGVQFHRQDGSDEARALENYDFLIFDQEAATQLAENYSEDTILNYLKAHQIIYTSPAQTNAQGQVELIAFSDFTQIPELFLNAFDSFELASMAKFNEFLESDAGRVDLVHLNPFTNPIYLKPEAFRPKTVQQVEVSEETSDLVLEIDNKKSGIIQVLGILKDFDFSNIAIADNNQLTFTFRKKQDVAIAKQILRMKTDLKIIS